MGRIGGRAAFGAALTFPVDDVAALDAALVRIAVDAALAKRMVEAGRVAAESYDWRKLAAKILKFYEEM